MQTRTKVLIAFWLSLLLITFMVPAAGLCAAIGFGVGAYVFKA